MKMKMKKQNLLTVMVLMAAVTAGNNLAVAADTTTVTISGTVRANTCTVGNKANGDLAPISVSDFRQASGTVVGSAVIPVVFTGCGNGTTGVRVTVSGKAAGSGGAFKNDHDGQTGGAKNVGIYLYDTDGTTLIKAGTDVAAKQQSFTTNTTLNYKASYVSLTDKVEAGSVLTTITMNFTYL
ncbi:MULTISPECIES: fimbrial protein [unclassified Pantoea]|jgi:type 1 fimbria pilin|uniref:fimbrial protein n=1 Tax=unclassified Pantoea TaxID=2630326 RepID=UPI0001E0B3BF|nr:MULTISPECIES: fimbrial protein [unclassified Pantoea]EFM19343.1 Fimbrial protein [Pantoea sp. aB]MDF2042166.1 fimbrial protein [Pantoea sp. Cr_R14]MDF2070620.1 fimbrial protein [Pantoea sp. Cr_R13]MDF2078274.1 fimbrial protein [Pantoea sp. Cr_R21]